MSDIAAAVCDIYPALDERHADGNISGLGNSTRSSTTTSDQSYHFVEASPKFRAGRTKTPNYESHHNFDRGRRGGRAFVLDI